MIYTPTTNDIEKMNRTDLVFEMAKHSHIDHYHSIIRMQTEHIRSLLRFYKCPPTFFIGIDFGFSPSQTIIHVVAGEELKRGQPVVMRNGKAFSAAPARQVARSTFAGTETMPYADTSKGPTKKSTTLKNLKTK